MSDSRREPCVTVTCTRREGKILKIKKQEQKNSLIRQEENKPYKPSVLNPDWHSKHSL